MKIFPLILFLMSGLFACNGPKQFCLRKKEMSKINQELVSPILDYLTKDSISFEEMVKSKNFSIFIDNQFLKFKDTEYIYKLDFLVINSMEKILFEKRKNKDEIEKIIEGTGGTGRRTDKFTDSSDYFFCEMNNVDETLAGINREILYFDSEIVLKFIIVLTNFDCQEFNTL